MGQKDKDCALLVVFKTMFLNSIRCCFFLILSFVCFKCVSGAYIHAMKEEGYVISVNLIRNDEKFDIPKNVRTSVHRSAYV